MINTDKIAKLREKLSNHSFTSYLKDKRVVIVGPNTNLRGKGLGTYIDSFDIIVRHNTVFDFLPFTADYKKDYGSRTDIIYFSPTCIKTYAHKTSTLDKIKKNKIKYIVYQNGNRDRNYLTGNYCFPEPLSWFKKHISSTGAKLHYSHNSTQLLTELMNDTNLSTEKVVPRTGFVSVFDMIVHNAREVETIGMSFAEGGGHSFRPDAIKEMDPLLTHRGKVSPHDSNIEKILAEEFMKIYPFKFN